RLVRLRGIALGESCCFLSLGLVHVRLVHVVSPPFPRSVSAMMYGHAFIHSCTGLATSDAAGRRWAGQLLQTIGVVQCYRDRTRSTCGTSVRTPLWRTTLMSP